MERNFLIKVIFGIFRLWKEKKKTLFVTAAWIPIATLTAALAFGNTRYRTAAEASLVILAAFSIDILMQKKSAEKTTL